MARRQPENADNQALRQPIWLADLLSHRLRRKRVVVAGVQLLDSSVSGCICVLLLGFRRLWITNNGGRRRAVICGQMGSILS